MTLTVTKGTYNPIAVPTGVNGSPDKVAVRDACFVRTSDGAFNAIYTGFGGSSLYRGMVTIRLSKASAWDGPYGAAVTISPDVSTFPSDVNTIGLSDPFVAFMGGQWHMWCSIVTVPTGVNPYRKIGHLVADGTATDIPTSGWIFENTSSLVAISGTFTNDGVAAPKVYPKDGGGYFMIFCGWGSNPAYQYQVGYAAASNLNGPWTVNTTSLIGTPGGYQAEQIVYFKGGGKHYLACNRLGLTGGAGYSGFPDLHIDLWQADSQTGPYTLAQYDFIPRGTGWESGDMGVVGLASYDLDVGTIYGIYNSVNTVGAIGYTQSLGAVAITLAVSTTTTTTTLAPTTTVAPATTTTQAPTTTTAPTSTTPAGTTTSTTSTTASPNVLTTPTITSYSTNLQALTLNWKNIPNNSGYLVEWGAGNQVSNSPSVGTNITSFILNNAQYNATYSFKVIAKGTTPFIDSAASPLYTVTMPSAPTTTTTTEAPLTAPAIVGRAAVTSSSMSLSVQAVAGAAYYRVYYNTDISPDTNSSFVEVTASGYVPITGLHANTTYVFKAMALATGYTRQSVLGTAYSAATTNTTSTTGSGTTTTAAPTSTTTTTLAGSTTTTPNGTTSTTSTPAPTTTVSGTTTTGAPNPTFQLRLNPAAFGPVRYRVGRKTVQLALGSGPARIMTSQGIKVLA